MWSMVYALRHNLQYLRVWCHTHADENSCGYHALYNSIYFLKIMNATSDAQVHGGPDTKITAHKRMHYTNVNVY